MSATHLHLILNHIPAAGLVFAGLLFLVARFKGSAPFQRVALWFIVAFALTAIPVYVGGESVEEAVEGLPGVSEAVIDRHEDAATVAFVAMEALGALALLSALGFRRKETPLVLAAGLGALVLTTTGLLSWTGYLGGQIRHTEIRPGSPAAATDQAGPIAERGAERQTRGGDGDD